jgi:hypothetical protein
MESKSSLTCPQKPKTEPYPEKINLSEIHFDVISSSRSPSKSLSLRIFDQHFPRISLTRSARSVHLIFLGLILI